jgi:DNA invertase Pin-like site-specific DNA recombinase
VFLNPLLIATAEVTDFRAAQVSPGMLGVFAEFERAMIRERVNAGLARARAQGKRLCRSPVAPMIADRVRRARAKGLSVREVAAKFDLGLTTVQRIVTGRSLA